MNQQKRSTFTSAAPTENAPLKFAVIVPVENGILATNASAATNTITAKTTHSAKLKAESVKQLGSSLYY
ncbi:MAG: hypothetical protein ACUZ8H_13190 [Candidatus Anammoxibacter sp.]